MFKNKEAFYKSKEWLSFREIFINDMTDAVTGDVYCSHCHKVILNKNDLIVHHKIELTDENVNDYNISLNPDNVEIICFNCHNKHHRRFGYENKKNVYLVWGAPCSGKSTWVNSVAQPNDLIVDMDSIYEMISINKRYTKPNGLKGIAFDIRDMLYDVVKYRRGKWTNAFVIGGYPMKGERERLLQQLNAEPKHIEATREECVERLYISKDRDINEWTKYIEDWFEYYQE